MKAFIDSIIELCVKFCAYLRWNGILGGKEERAYLYDALARFVASIHGPTPQTADSRFDNQNATLFSMIGVDAHDADKVSMYIRLARFRVGVMRWVNRTNAPTFAGLRKDIGYLNFGQFDKMLSAINELEAWVKEITKSDSAFASVDDTEDDAGSLLMYHTNRLRFINYRLVTAFGFIPKSPKVSAQVQTPSQAIRA